MENLHGQDWANDQDFAKSFAKPVLSKNQALAAAKPKVKSIFGLQMNGYSVQIKKTNTPSPKKALRPSPEKSTKKERSTPLR
ncbi:hypothetical protein VQ056_02730 [Paenibacillus sp. JTLBN-2024]